MLGAYGWPTDLTDQQILERLLALNLARASEAPASQTPVSEPEPEADLSE